MAERPGNDLFVSLGQLGFDLDDPNSANYLRSVQALVLMHELGHNLGLSHGGHSTHMGDELADEANYKPNYLSVMNYLYSHRALPSITQDPGDRYYHSAADQDPACAAKGVTLDSMTGSPLGPLNQVRIDFSDGSGASFSLAAVHESAGLGRPGGAWVDYNCNGGLDPAQAHGLFVTHDDGESFSVIKDHDDWGGLDLFFTRTKAGYDQAPVPRPGERAPSLGDAGPLAIEGPQRRAIARELARLAGGR